MKKLICILSGMIICSVFVCQFLILQNFRTENRKKAQSIKQEEIIPEINWEETSDTIVENDVPIEDVVIEGQVSNIKTPTSKQANISDENVFEGCYGYSILSDEDKLLYNEIYTSIMNYDNSVLLTTKNIDKLEHVYYVLDADHGEIFWVNGYNYIYYTTDGEITNIEFCPVYTFDKESVDKYRELLLKRRDEFLLMIDRDASDYEKAKYVYEVLIRNVEYDTNSEHNQTLLSALLNGNTVCKGYACAAQYLLKELGIDSVIISGFANNETHAWNCVKLNGQWYHFDVTWGNSKYQMPDESVGKHIDYTYLNTTENSIRKTHTIDERFEIPVCDATEDNYFVKEGKYIDYWDEEYVGNILSEACNNGSQNCSIMFANDDLYMIAMTHLFFERNIVKYCEGITSYSYLENKTEGVITINFNR